jgi:hypothetical protein
MLIKIKCKENVEYTLNEILLIHNFSKMDITTQYYEKWSSPEKENQVPCILSNVWKLKIK